MGSGRRPTCVTRPSWLNLSPRVDGRGLSTVSMPRAQRSPVTYPRSHSQGRDPGRSSGAGLWASPLSYCLLRWNSGVTEKEEVPRFAKIERIYPQNAFEPRVTRRGRGGRERGPPAVLTARRNEACERWAPGNEGTRECHPGAHPGASAEAEAGFSRRQRGWARGRTGCPGGAHTGRPWGGRLRFML